MKITVEYDKDLDKSIPLRIESAKYLNDYSIYVRFNNNKERIIDFKPFLYKSQHPDLKKYLDKKLFTDFSIKDGNLNWNDYDMIFPINDLYEGNIS